MQHEIFEAPAGFVAFGTFMAAAAYTSAVVYAQCIIA